MPLQLLSLPKGAPKERATWELVVDFLKARPAPDPIFPTYELDRGPWIPRDAWQMLALVSFCAVLLFGCGFVAGRAHEQAEHPIVAEAN